MLLLRHGEECKDVPTCVGAVGPMEWLTIPTLLGLS